MTTIPLTLKELAWELGVSVRYVENMRAAGFPMELLKMAGCGERLFLTSTVEQALEWIDANEFRLVHCRPVLTVGQLRLGCGGNRFEFLKPVVQMSGSQRAFR